MYVCIYYETWWGDSYFGGRTVTPYPSSFSGWESNNYLNKTIYNFDLIKT